MSKIPNKFSIGTCKKTAPTKIILKIGKCIGSIGRAIKIFRFLKIHPHFKANCQASVGY